VTEADLPILFDQQLDPEANRMAAFPARDLDAFMAHWTKIMADKSLRLRTILADGQVAGNVVCFGPPDEREIGYWIGRAFWGKGVATRALSAFLVQVEARPLYAHVVSDNVGSIRVLEKCGFTVVHRVTELSEQRGEEVEALILKLDGDDKPTT
jgi:RimJ/RimL family protein N-acetyltransferase